MRKLIYYLYLPKNWRETLLYKIHFNCLSYYSDCFDEAYFAISLDDIDDTDTILEAEQKIIGIFQKIKKIEFEIVKNTNLYEVPIFKKEIVDRLGQDDLVFFAHGKGISNFTWCEPERVYETVCALYYLSLQEEKEKYEISNKLTRLDADMIAYGSLQTIYTYKPHIKSLYEWHYMGTFFWINSKRLKHYITNNNITVPEVGDRFYSENFLSNIIPITTSEIGEGLKGNVILASAYHEKYMFSDTPNESIYNYILDYMFEGEENKFNNFVENMKKV